MAVEAVEVVDGEGQFGDPLAFIEVTLVLRHAPQGDETFDTREVTGRKAIRVTATDVAEVLRLVVDRVRGHEIVAKSLRRRQCLLVAGTIVDLHETDQQATVAPKDGHVATTVDGR